jgi:hypothetical protein
MATKSKAQSKQKRAGVGGTNGNSGAATRRTKKSTRSAGSSGSEKYPVPTERLAWGGVSPVQGKPAAYGLQSITNRQGPVTTAASANPNFAWHGGPVVPRPQVFSSFWGPTWAQPANQQRADRLNQYLKDLLQSKYMNILTQYGVGAGAGAGGSFIKSTFIQNVPTTLTDNRIQQIIQSGINSGIFPEPSDPTNNVLVIFLGEGIAINDPAQRLVLCNPVHDSAFGYHSFFRTTAGHPFYYSMIPALDNNCLRVTCPNDATCSLHLSETQEQRQTQVTSHEFAEMTTDPQLNAWFDATTRAENGDICNGEAGTITVGPRTWTVQRMYSKFDDVKSNGSSFCVTEPANPLPRLSPGPPAALPLSMAGFEQPHLLELMLPLPTVHFDPQTESSRMDEQELRDYLTRLFSPFGEEQVITDLPAFLREAATILSKK